MRHWFGGSLTDWVFTSATVDGLSGVPQLAPDMVVTFWDQQVGGTQYTDLLDASGAPVTQIVTDTGSLGGSPGQIPRFQGPDGVGEMWAQAGGGPRALMVTTGPRPHWHDTTDIVSGVFEPARLPAGSGGGGGLGEVWVAASDAPPEFAGAEYACTGTADDVELQAAIDAATTTGRQVRTSPGRFNLSAPLRLDSGRDAACQVLTGSGMAETVLDATATGLPAAIVVSNGGAPVVQDMTIQVGAGVDGISGVPGDASTCTDGGLFRRLRIRGAGGTSGTNWGINLTSAIYTTIDHVEVDGTGQGVRLATSGAGWEAFNVSLRGVFVWVDGTGGRGLSLETSGYPVHTVDVSDSYFGGGDLAAAIYAGGTHPVRGVTVRSTYVTGRTAVHVSNGQGFVVDLSHMELNAGASRTALIFDAGAFGNRVSIAEWRTSANATLVADANTTMEYAPNEVGPVRMYVEPSATVGLTRNPAGTTVLRGIVNDGGGTVSAVQRSPLIDAPHHVVPLPNSSSHTIDCRRGSHFRFTATANFTLQNPLHPVDGQRILLEIKQDATGSRVMTPGSKFRFSTTFPNATLTTTANKTDKVEWQYHGADDRWDLIRFVKGI